MFDIDFSWGEFLVGVIWATAAIYYGRWTQRKDDRRKARKAQERRMAQVLAAADAAARYGRDRRGA